MKRTMHPRSSHLRTFIWVCMALALPGCLAIAPRFPQEVAADFAQQSMRKLETQHVTLYYPESRKGRALQVATALERCTQTLRANLVEGPEQPTLLAYLTDANFNNAYVQALTPGLEQQMVLADAMTFELFNWLNLGLSRTGDISCHEAVHAVHVAEIHGFWKGINLVTGGILSPQIFTQTWFLEGLATHYEGKLIPTGGRPGSPMWRGLFASGVASTGGSLSTADLSPANRTFLPYGAQYLVGMNFIDFLAKRYGEKKLWELLDRQGSSIFSPLGVTLRFDAVYDKTIGGLMEEYEAYLKRTVVARARPVNQRVIEPDAGYVGRMAASRSTGAVALIVARRNDVVRLVVRERDGRLRFETPLTQIIPIRRWIVVNPSAISGLSFSGDGSSIFFQVDDLNSVGAFEGRLVQVSAKDGSIQRLWTGLTGLGGGVSPDGSSFAFVDQASKTSNLARLDLETGAKQVLTNFENGTTLGSPVISPNGKRIAFARWTANGFNLSLYEGNGTVRALTQDGRSSYGPRWIDDEHLIFTRELDGRLQAHELDLQSGNISVVTNAPYVVIDAAPAGPDSVAFLNREGWSWTVDVAPRRALAAASGQRVRGEITAVRIPTPGPLSPLPIGPGGAPSESKPSLNTPAENQGGSSQNGAGTETGAARVDGGTSSSDRAGERAMAPQVVTQHNSPDAGTSVVATQNNSPDAGTSMVATQNNASDAGASHVVTQNNSPDAGTSPLIPDRNPPNAGVAASPPDTSGTPPSNVHVDRDRPYSPFEQFFLPRLRVPFLALVGELNPSATTFTPGAYITGSLSGIDRLGFHSWAFTGAYNTLTGENSQAFAYGNYALAPWYTTLTLSRARLGGTTDLAATLSSQREFWTTPLALSFTAIQRRVADDEFGPVPPTRLIGPSFATRFTSLETLPYGGPRRGLVLSLSGAAYPRAFGSSFDLGDVGAGIQTFVPLPFTHRHSLQLFLRGRGVFGGPEPLLRVGGGGALATIPARPGDPDPALPLPPGIFFFEPLRGYEDHATAARMTGITGATYRYPFIIDYGWSSFLWLFPQVFLRQVDLDLFGQAAYVQGPRNGWLRSAGASLALRTVWLDAVPISLIYQFAYRFDDGLSPLHVIGLGIE